MSDESAVCYFECKHPLTEIDKYGQWLRGCMNCNIWWSLLGAKVRLSEQGLLHQLRRGKAGHGVEKKPPDDEGWGGELLARYERGVMLFLFSFAVTIVGLIICLGAHLVGL